MFIQLSSLRPPVERFAYTGAQFPKISVILFVEHRVLGKGEPETDNRGMGGNIP